MSEAAIAYDEDLDLSPEVQCSLLRRRAMTEYLSESEHERSPLPEPVRAKTRLSPIWG